MTWFGILLVAIAVAGLVLAVVREKEMFALVSVFAAMLLPLSALAGIRV